MTYDLGLSDCLTAQYAEYCASCAKRKIQPPTLREFANGADPIGDLMLERGDDRYQAWRDAR